MSCFALACPVCLQSYDEGRHGSRVLPCGHTFCAECIETMILDGPQVMCSIDRRTFGVPIEGLAPNFVVSQLLAAAAKPEEAMCAVCSEQHKATCQCLDCAQHMCKHAADLHTRFLTSKHHQVRPLDDASTGYKKSLCCKHSKSWDLFDVKCNCLVCVDCILGEHRGHDFQSITEAARHCRTSIDALRETTQAKMIEWKKSEETAAHVLEELDEAFQREQTQLNEFFEEVRTTVAAREKLLFQELNASHQTKRALLMRQCQGLQNLVACVEGFDRRVMLALQRESDTQLILATREMMQLVGVHPILEPEEDACLNIVLDRTLLNAIAKAGRLTKTTCAFTSSISDLQARSSQLTFKIVARDAQYNPKEHGGDCFDIALAGEAKLEDLNNGTYNVSCELKEDCTLSVCLRGHHIQGSPAEINSGAPKLVRTWSSTQAAWGIAVLDSEIFATSFTTHLIHVFHSDGTFARSWGSCGPGAGQFNSPWGIAISSSGEVFVSDCINHRIQVFRPDGTFLRMWGSRGSARGQFSNPAGIAVANGEVFVVDYSNNRVQVFRADGSFLRGWGTGGTRQGQFRCPSDIAISSQGEVFVSDTGNHRIQVFSTQGSYLRSWGLEGSDCGRFKKPHGVAVSKSGEICVADTDNRRIQAFRSDGMLLYAWDLKMPDRPRTLAIATSVTGEMFVSHSSNQISVFR